MSKSTVMECRHCARVVVPCNWVKEGSCGIDAGHCEVKEVKEKA